jgi:hypothetical protein
MMLLPAFSTDPYHHRLSGGIYGAVAQGGDPDSVFNQFDPPPATLQWSVDPYKHRLTGGPLGAVAGGGDPESIFNIQPCGLTWEECM